jgi:DNA-binding transcriptional regulator LsrR (DeoR family)
MAPKKAEALDRDRQILSRLSRIEHKVDSMDQTQAFALRADADKHFKSVQAIFKSGKRRAQIYLAADGVRGVQEIAEHLKMQRQNVGPELKKLAAEGMLEIVETNGGKDIWGKKPVDRTLRVSQFLQTEFSLRPDGLSAAANKAKRKSVSKRR